MVLATRKMHLIITHVLSVYTHVRLKVQPPAILLYPWLLWSQSFIVATHPLNVYTSSKLFSSIVLLSQVSAVVRRQNLRPHHPHGDHSLLQLYHRHPRRPPTCVTARQPHQERRVARPYRLDAQEALQARQALAVSHLPPRTDVGVRSSDVEQRRSDIPVHLHDPKHCAGSDHLRFLLRSASGSEKRMEESALVFQTERWSENKEDLSAWCEEHDTQQYAMYERGKSETLHLLGWSVDIG